MVASSLSKLMTIFSACDSDLAVRSNTVLTSIWDHRLRLEIWHLIFGSKIWLFDFRIRDIGLRTQIWDSGVRTEIRNMIRSQISDFGSQICDLKSLRSDSDNWFVKLRSHSELWDLCRLNIGYRFRFCTWLVQYAVVNLWCRCSLARFSLMYAIMMSTCTGDVRYVRQRVRPGWRIHTKNADVMWRIY